MDADEIVRTLDEVYFQQLHERETITNLNLLLRDGDRVVDVGASLGQSPCFLNERFSNLSITCIEPDVIRYRELQRRCAAWTSEGKNTMSAIHAAACAHEGVVDFYSTSSNVSGSIVDSDFELRFLEIHEMTARGEPGRTAPPSPQVTTVSVPAITLDSLCGGAAPQLVKIDVEGAEYDVIRGSTHLLEQGITQFLIELDKRSHNLAMLQAFERHGYRAIRFFNHTLFFHPTSSRRVPRYIVLLRRIWCKGTRRLRRGPRLVVPIQQS